MSLRSLSPFALCLAVALVGCPSDPVGNDAGMTPMNDAFTPMGADAPGMMGADAPGMMGADAPAMMGADAPAKMGSDAPAMMGSDAPVRMIAASWADVHDQLTMRCTPCHSSGMSGGHRMAQANATMAYADSQLAAVACAGLTKGACAAMRVRAGTMPPGGLPEPARTELANLMDSWVAAGQTGP